MNQTEREPNILHCLRQLRDYFSNNRLKCADDQEIRVSSKNIFSEILHAVAEFSEVYHNGILAKYCGIMPAFSTTLGSLFEVTTTRPKRHNIFKKLQLFLQLTYLIFCRTR